MSIKRRLSQIESLAGISAADHPNCILLCTLTNDPDVPSEPRVAYLLRGKMGEEVWRGEDESGDEFRERVTRLMEVSA